MAGLGFLQMFGFFLAASLLISPISAQTVTSALFAFGDGLYDLGNDIHLNSGSQYNIHPYGNSTDGPTGRPSDGHLVVDFIADYSDSHQLVRPYLAQVPVEWVHGASFATAGAQVVSDDPNYTISKQLEYFQVVRDYLVNTLGETKALELLSNSLYLITFGTTEYFKLGPQVDAFTLRETIDIVIEAYEGLIRGIYSLGGRKFGIQNIGPLWEMPYFKYYYNTSGSPGCSDDFTPVAQWHNILLEIKLQQWATCPQLDGFQYAYFDYYSVVTNLTSTFENGTDACCGNEEYNGNMTCGTYDKNSDPIYNLCSDSKQYVWFDGVHPSQAANEKIAEQFWNGTSSVVRPDNLKQLLEGSTDSTGAKKRPAYSVSV